MEDKREVEISIQQDVAVVTFGTSSISDVDKIAVASRQINEFISKNQPKRMIFDFGGVKFFCSRVLGLLLEIRGKVEEYGGQMAISAINPQLYRVFKITNLDKIFQFFPDRQSAVDAMKSGQALM